MDTSTPDVRRTSTGPRTLATATVAVLHGGRSNEREVSLAQMSLAHGCDTPDAGCMADIANTLKVDRLIYGTMTRQTGAFEVSLFNFDAISGQIEATAKESMSDAQMANSNILTTVIGRMTQALSGKTPTGTVMLAGAPNAGRVELDGVDVGRVEQGQGLRIDDVVAGEHLLTIKSQAGASDHRVIVEEGKVAELDPRAPSVNTELGDALREQDKLDDALKHYMKAQNVNRSDKRAHAGAAMVYEKKGDNKHALDEWSSYIQMDCCSDFSKTVAQKKIESLKVDHGGEELKIRMRSHLRRKRYADRMRRAVEEGLRNSVRDSLTQLHNRRYLDTHFAKHFALAKKTGGTLSVLIFDLDQFKKINDTLGHAIGDAALIRFGQLLEDEVRVGDLCARYGGEEFVVVMPGADAKQAAAAAERVRARIAADHVANGSRLSFTVSAGVAAIRRTDGSPEELMSRADQALLEAKSGGRDRVACG